MKSPAQRVIAQRRLALVTERTPLQTPAPSSQWTQEEREVLATMIDGAMTLLEALAGLGVPHFAYRPVAPPRTFLGTPIRFTDKMEYPLGRRGTI